MADPLVVQPMPEHPIISCQCPLRQAQDGKLVRRTNDDGCTCINSERALIAWAYNDFYRSMTHEQRLWCMVQIDNAVDPMLKIPLSRMMSFSDNELAAAVLISWIDQYDERERSSSEQQS